MMASAAENVEEFVESSGVNRRLQLYQFPLRRAAQNRGSGITARLFQSHDAPPEFIRFPVGLPFLPGSLGGTGVPRPRGHSRGMEKNRGHGFAQSP